jgi:hypothetical protein
MNVELQPDPDNGLNVNVHTTFDESDEQFPQPWSLWIIEIQEHHEVASGTDDLAVTLPRQGIFTFEIACNNSTARVKYSTGEVALPGPAMPVQITAADPDTLPVTGGFESRPVALTGSGFQSQGEVGGPNVVMAMLANEAGTAEVSSGGGTFDGDTGYNVSFTQLPAGVAPGDKGFIYTKSAMMEPSSNKFEIGFVEPPPPPPAPTIESVTPNTGATAGGDTIVVAGTGLVGTTGVKTSSSNAVLGEITDTSITCVTTGMGAAGTWDVTVQHPNGDAVLPGGFTATGASPGEEPTQTREA